MKRTDRQTDGLGDRIRGARFARSLKELNSFRGNIVIVLEEVKRDGSVFENRRLLVLELLKRICIVVFSCCVFVGVYYEKFMCVNI